MKKGVIFFLSLTLLGCGDKKKTKIVEESPDTNTNETVQEKKPTKVDPNAINPFVNGILDVEQLDQDIDMSMDISQLSLSDIRVLRNSYAAKKGYCFMKADLRGVFGTTSWYNDRMHEKYWNDEEGTAITPILYTPEEIKFIDKLKKREEELKKKNFLSTKGPNLNNIVNLFQLESVDKQLMSMLGKNGFAIVPNTNIQLFHVYEQNDYQQFPNFVTTDMYMQLFHMYFGYILRTVEEDKFIPLLSEICKSMMKAMNVISIESTEISMQEMAKFNETYYAIAYAILTSEKVTVPDGYEKYYEEELSAIENAEDTNSEFLEYKKVAFPYSLFKPRGHYTRTESLKRYFKAMMWLQTAPFCLDNDAQLKRAILSASVLKNNKETLKKYNAIMEPINFIIGQPDNVSFLDLVKILEEQDFLLENLLLKEGALEDFRGIIKKIADIKNKIKTKEARSCIDKINFIPQRYLSDNEVLQELVDLKSEVSKRAYPKGLDVMAAFGSKSAENLLLGELKEGKNWEDYPELLSGMKDKMSDINWDATLYNKWIESLLNLQKSKEEYPYFMQTTQWGKKDLNASLASWAELKHDAILYAEQPMAAECGDGGPPSPYTVGYVEPNIGYWKSVIELINLTESVLERNKLINSDISRITNSLRENGMFLLSASKKELAGKKLSDNEYRQIELIGSTFEWLTLDLVKEKDQYLDDWQNVQGPDKSVAVVADIYTANGGNNPDKGILHVATGNVNDIYVLVEIEGYLYLTKGAVFGYHEFHLPMGNRLTDEEWQEMIDKNQAPPLLDWMKEIILPIDVPKSNEKIFYSSGC